ncbi:MAG: phosphatidylserine decarboxylase [Nitrospirae bacterium RIFOXYB2_FULL_43_5]|nr:MAG: phosphatidylserine decarboxylase [Nitrospirae bacterium GWF2_44_13]OGW32123.1 MAG: phosphatidylserine decarboxylase [Nitrospirae bacterium GWD2_44_7]OGW65645.1 MAG: phosphatidylserine decarboxylase [Nitrospirae bacterium RIFOXYA2_FULL_44_9]OGW70756.1 MAG: phosphatidylserine decarboxylase [Nitrospirae bacterium RIFOXYC2_FULL_44_7]OGW76761.1 MAG: phosphatidylserine decarboxylase [Nitrospirae bacterium RIFOXYB2_FULL_43_5]HBG92547.1 phosphatidylserine decarboxylase family protein [Nitrospi
MMKLASEGYPYIIIFAATTIVALLLGGKWMVMVSFVITVFMVYFFRDPEREIPEGEGLFVSPADGRIILIKDVFEKEHLKAAVIEISIFMSPFNVHVNRAPCDGKIKGIRHNKGKFIAAYKDEASFKNENIEMTLETKYGDMLVRQVAGYVARRAVCRANTGDSLKRGERYGIIKFSSRLDVYIPKDTAVKVKLGDRVKAGETVIGVIG